MKINKLSRKEKEDLYKEKMTKLQLAWENPLLKEDEWNFDEWTDEQLSEGLKSTIESLRFEQIHKIFSCGDKCNNYCYITKNFMYLFKP